MPAKNRNLFRLTRFILLNIPYLLYLLGKFRKPSKRILIIKTDAIGDYILFRNFLKEVKSSTLYQNYQIDLLGNKLWQEVALTYDQKFVSDFYFIQPLDLYHQPIQVCKLGWQLFKQNYAITLQPSYTRTFINDGLAAFTTAKQIIGFEGDEEAISNKIKTKTDRFYTQKLKLNQSYNFEFDRTRFFFDNFLQKSITLNGPKLPVTTSEVNYILFCVGAGNAKRTWPAINLLKLAELILKETNFNIYLLGTSAADTDASFISKNFSSDRIKNFVGHTSLIEFINFITNAALIICNESSATHIASACNKKSISVLGGGHFERFAPYPNQMSNQSVFAYEKMDCYNCNWICKFKTFHHEPFPCISIVTLDQVWQSVQKLLNINNLQ